MMLFAGSSEAEATRARALRSHRGAAVSRDCRTHLSDLGYGCVFNSA